MIYKDYLGRLGGKLPMGGTGRTGGLGGIGAIGGIGRTGGRGGIDPIGCTGCTGGLLKQCGKRRENIHAHGGQNFPDLLILTPPSF